MKVLKISRKECIGICFWEERRKV